MRIRYYSSVGAFFMKQSMQAYLEYPWNMTGWLVSNLMQFGIGFAIIKFVVEQFGTMKGWGFEELAFLYGLSVLSHGLSVVAFTQTWYLGHLIVEGALDIFLLRPLNILFQFLFMDFNLIGVTDLISGVILFSYGCAKVHFSWTLTNIAALLAVIAGGTLIRGAIWMFCSSISFWSKSRSHFVAFWMQLYDKTTMYPLTIYPKFLQVLFTMVIPLGWITFYPAGAFLDKEMPFYIPAGIPFYTLAIGLACYLLSCLMFYRGLKHYESAGT